MPADRLPLSGRLARSRSGPALAAVALLGALSACRSLPTVIEGPAPEIDFEEILLLAELYRSVRYDSAERIHDAWDGRYELLEVVEIPATRNRYLLGTLSHGRQEVVIRGTANWTNAVFDVRIRRHWNAELGIELHKGFEEMAAALLQDLVPRLRPDRELVLFGHSLGAAEAVILGLQLDHQGYSVRRVYASGQPRLTDTAGAMRYGGFPVLRIVNGDDPVPLLPSVRDLFPARSYCHFGDALMLLDGPYYAYFHGDYVNERLGAVLWNNLLHGRLLEEFHEHSIGNYILRIAPKLEAALQVPFRDRMRYLYVPLPPGKTMKPSAGLPNAR
jgi:pimeloyl-ACP methyl ester carboxylesterase